MIVGLIAVSILVGVVSTVVLLLADFSIWTAVILGYVGGGFSSISILSVIYFKYQDGEVLSKVNNIEQKQA